MKYLALLLLIILAYLVYNFFEVILYSEKPVLMFENDKKIKGKCREIAKVLSKEKYREDMLVLKINLGGQLYETGGEISIKERNDNDMRAEDISNEISSEIYDNLVDVFKMSIKERIVSKLKFDKVKITKPAGETKTNITFTNRYE